MEKFYPTWKIPEIHEVVQIQAEAFENLLSKKPLMSPVWKVFKLLSWINITKKINVDIISTKY